MKQTEGLIFTNENRFLEIKDGNSAEVIFSKEAFFPEFGDSLPEIIAFKNHSLAPSQSTNSQTLKDTFSIILPLVGGVEFRNISGQPIVSVGEIYILNATECIEIGNPFEGYAVKFLEIQMRISNFSASDALRTFQIEANINSLLNIFEANNVQIYIGKFGSRIEETMLSGNIFNTFVYVISGTFEVEDRLICSNEALALKYLNILEFESLDQENSILIISIAQ